MSSALFTTTQRCQENSTYFELQIICLRQTIDLYSVGMFSWEKNYVVDEMTALKWVSFIGQIQTNSQLAFVVRL